VHLPIEKHVNKSECTHKRSSTGGGEAKSTIVLEGRELKPLQVKHKNNIPGSSPQCCGVAEALPPCFGVAEKERKIQYYDGDVFSCLASSGAADGAALLIIGASGNSREGQKECDDHWPPLDSPKARGAEVGSVTVTDTV